MSKFGKCIAELTFLALAAISACAQQIDPSQIRAGNLAMQSYDGFEVHVQKYPGLTYDQQLTSALAAWANVAGPVTFIMDKPGTMAAGVSITHDARSLRFNADLHLTGKNGIYLSPNSSVSCAQGANISGIGDMSGALFLLNRGKNYDLLSGCTMHDLEYLVAVQYTSTDAPQNVKVHDFESYSIFITDVLAGGSRQDVASDPTQPRHLKIYNAYVHDQGGGLLTCFACHDVEAFSNVGVNMVNPNGLNYFLFAGANIYDVGGFALPTGASSEINFHDNYVDGVGAAEFVNGSINVKLGHGSYATNVQDVAFDHEGNDNWSIDGATCGNTGNGCATSFFSSRHGRIHGVTSPQSGILIKNSNSVGFPERVTDLEISNNDVPFIAVESGEGLRISGNKASNYNIGPNLSLKMFNNDCLAQPSTASLQTCYNIGSTYGGTIATMFNNSARLDLSGMPSGVTPNPLNRAFAVTSQFFSATSNYMLDTNRNSGFPVFLDAVVNPGNTVATNLRLVNNHKGGGTTTTRLDGGMGSVNVIEPLYWDANEVMHVTTSGAVFDLPGSGVAPVCIGTDGALYRGTSTGCQ